jgi:hypothetical protein
MGEGSSEGHRPDASVLTDRPPLRDIFLSSVKNSSHKQTKKMTIKDTPNKIQTRN